MQNAKLTPDQEQNIEQINPLIISSVLVRIFSYKDSKYLTVTFMSHSSQRSNRQPSSGRPLTSDNTSHVSPTCECQKDFQGVFI